MTKFAVAVGEIIDRSDHAVLGGRTRSRISSVRDLNYIFVFVGARCRSTVINHGSAAVKHYGRR